MFSLSRVSCVCSLLVLVVGLVVCMVLRMLCLLESFSSCWLSSVSGV